MPSLDIATLGHTKVQVEGKPAHWQSQAAENVFFYLLSHPEGRTREDIIRVLWNLDVDPHTLNRLRVTLHRIRSALQTTDAIWEDYGRLRISKGVLESTDLFRFYHMLEASEHGAPGDRIRHLQSALQLYTGDYLSDESADWVLLSREEHRLSYVRATLELSLLFCETSACESAVGALTRALRADPFVGENHHQKLMTCLSVVEDKYAAIEHYRRFLKFLRDELGDQPMPETIELARRIKTGEPICRKAVVQVSSEKCSLKSGEMCPGKFGSW